MTIEKLQLLAALLAGPTYANLSAAECITNIHAATLPNPEPQGQVLRPLVKGEVMALLSPESQKKVVTFPNLTLVFTSFDVQDHQGAVVWVYSLEIAECVTTAEREACVAHIMTPIPDPSYQALRSWAELNQVDPTETDVARARLLPKRVLAQQNAEHWAAIVSELDAGIDVEFEVE